MRMPEEKIDFYFALLSERRSNLRKANFLVKLITKEQSLWFISNVETLFLKLKMLQSSKSSRETLL